ncbi:MAG: hypothetical protein Q4A37_00540 [Candidatus Saccharibacteria bacterium]|nr:hypothetical protein [Candidatus Saccharibacteria bacterium]
MSRAMLKRLMAVQPPTVSATSPSGDGVAGNAAQPQSFAQRQRLERQRKLVGSYQQSTLGVQNYKEEVGAAGSTTRSRLATPPQSTDTPERIDTGQNRPSAGFKEPPSRGYNPYA